MENDFLQKYQAQCKRTAKPFDNKKEEIMAWGLGIAGEAGDVAGCIKKTVVHDNNQIEGIKENLGDTLWYLAMICSYYGWNLQEVMQANLDKLEKRFSGGFTNQAAGRNNTKIDWNEK